MFIFFEDSSMAFAIGGLFGTLMTFARIVLHVRRGEVIFK